MPPCHRGGGREEEGAIDWEGMAGPTSIQKHVLADVKTERRIAVEACVVELQSWKDGRTIGPRVLENRSPPRAKRWAKRPTQQFGEAARKASATQERVRRI